MPKRTYMETLQDYEIITQDSKRRPLTVRCKECPYEAVYNVTRMKEHTEKQHANGPRLIQRHLVPLHSARFTSDHQLKGEMLLANLQVRLEMFSMIFFIPCFSGDERPVIWLPILPRG